MKRSLALAAVLVVTLAGCAPTAEVVAPTPAPVVETPSATPTPVPTVPAATGLQQPGQVFEGECGALLGEADASTILGAQVAVVESDPVDNFRTALVMQAGGVECEWSDSARTVGLSLTAAPAYAAGELDAPEACLPNRRDVIGDITCGVASESNDIVVSGIVGFGGGTSAAAKKKASAIVVKLAAAIESNSTADMATTETLPAPGAWANPGVAPDTNPPTCADVDGAIDSGDFMGGGARGALEEVFDNPGYVSPLASDLVGNETNEPWWCTWFAKRSKAEIDKGQISQLQSRALGGGAWMLDRVADVSGAKKLTIDGVDRAFRVTDSFGQVSIWASDGANAASFAYYAGQKDKDYRSVAIVIEALNALAG